MTSGPSVALCHSSRAPDVYARGCVFWAEQFAKDTLVSYRARVAIFGGSVDHTTAAGASLSVFSDDLASNQCILVK